MGQAMAGVPKEGKGGILQGKCVAIRVKAVGEQVLKLVVNEFKGKKEESNTFCCLKNLNVTAAGS